MGEARAPGHGAEWTPLPGGQELGKLPTQLEISTNCNLTLTEELRAGRPQLLSWYTVYTSQKCTPELNPACKCFIPQSELMSTCCGQTELGT